MRCTQSICPVPLWASPSLLSVSKYHPVPCQRVRCPPVGGRWRRLDRPQSKHVLQLPGFQPQMWLCCRFNGCAYLTGCVMWSWSCCSLPSSTSRSKERAGLYEWSSTSVVETLFQRTKQAENTVVLFSSFSLCSLKHSLGLFLVIHVYFSLLTFSFRTLFQVP